MVTPMPMSSMPLISTISPGPASVACTRSRPWKVSTWLMRPLMACRPGPPSPRHVHAGLDRALADAAHADAADEGRVVQREICSCSGAAGSPLCGGTCLSMVSNRADMSGPHCSPGAPSSSEDQPLMPEA
jgi:hypothetical protein